ncbi:MAG TPA: UDP-N-acetylmuramoyl-L-alanyl-D-glutamate--2,6-diaminopimelate ligase, partial [Bacteroidaceae bacterium]|nr:UDP-N-acetylmuramoyl-L-alanyl-D-glutamate--2,6-diaminopimelate ligase [Bacteroidaceae bacterium]
MKIHEVIEGLKDYSVTGNSDLEINGLTFDSRNVQKDDLFIAVKGLTVDGHHFIDQAVENGASVVVCEKGMGKTQQGITYIEVPNTRKALGIIASNFYGNPSKELQLIGVTGTNGKTTIATLLYNIHLALGYSAGLLSTIEVKINGRSYTATHTTPDPLRINYYLREMVDTGCGYCFMEVSSHAVSQERIAGLTFKGGIFTNLTQDHLDYYAT